MTEIVFTVDDLTEVRFCTSPLWETVFSVRAYAAPGRFPALGPWLRATRLALADRPEVDEHRAYLAEFSRPGSWQPDFLTPPPRGSHGELTKELDELMTTPRERITADILDCANWRPLTAVARAAAANPDGVLDRLRAAIEAWHDLAIAPHWARMQALLDADIAYRTRQLSRGGLRLLFETLHPSVHWSGDRLVSDYPWKATFEVAGRGLPLQPSVFVDRRVLWNVSADAPPLLVYPVRAVGTLWSTASAPGGALARVFGPARAEVLALLRAPATTSDLARRTGLSLGAVSQHLTALRGAGIVASQRHGREVIYEVTDIGVALLRANGLG
jgi:DNA-binding transcriptional ArsR family regulator